jgi:hypothetical protein
MTEKRAPTAGPIVSVEREVVGASAGARLADGVLVGRDVVLVPDPPQQLIDRTDDLRVCITSRPAGDGKAEHIRVTTVKTLSLDVSDARTTRIAMLRLARRSRYVVEVPDVENKDLAKILVSTGGDLWATLRELGYVAIESGNKDPETSEVTALSGGHAAALAAFCWGLCDWLPCCRK